MNDKELYSQQDSAQQAWLRDLAALQDQVERDDGLHCGKTDEEIVDRMRQTRQEIYTEIFCQERKQPIFWTFEH